MTVRCSTNELHPIRSEETSYFSNGWQVVMISLSAASVGALFKEAPSILHPPHKNTNDNSCRLAEKFATSSATRGRHRHQTRDLFDTETSGSLYFLSSSLPLRCLSDGSARSLVRIDVVKKKNGACFAMEWSTMTQQHNMVWMRIGIPY